MLSGQSSVNKAVIPHFLHTLYDRWQRGAWIAMNLSRSEFVSVRGLRYHVRHWGRADAPMLFMLHGWMDVSASFQFMVDCLRQDWHVIAPDWRGFGLTRSPGVDTYWFPDYLADLDALLQHYSPQHPVNLVGHSMGGNILGIYAGVRPQRVCKAVNLEGFGLAATDSKQAPARFAQWLDGLNQPPALRTYESLEAVAGRLQKTNPRLSDERAAFLAIHWAEQDGQGRWRILADPAHKSAGPLLYQLDQMTACWQAITAPVLCVEAEDTDMWKWMGPKEGARHEIDRRIGLIPNATKVMIADAGHMLHHDQPQVLAQLIERFLDQGQA
jgi:pimeloyl-ACP methyl ester carboxylesterase